MSVNWCYGLLYQYFVLSLVVWRLSIPFEKWEGRISQGQAEQSKAALCPALSIRRLYLPGSLGLHCIWDQLPIYLHTSTVFWAPAQYCVWCYPRCIPAQKTRMIPEQKHDGRYLSDLSEGLSCTQFDWHVFWSGDQSDFRWVLLVRHLW